MHITTERSQSEKTSYYMISTQRYSEKPNYGSSYKIIGCQGLAEREREKDEGCRVHMIFRAVNFSV